jgi:2-C-methyl-D-erythritol 4-phosphate cytidylyltransferase
MTDRFWAVVPAAGTGSRMQAERPKQYLSLGAATVLEHSVAALLSLPEVRAVVVAVSAGDQVAGALPGLSDSRVRWAEGGAQRMDSVLSALEVLADMASDDDWVLVHDAARPCVRPADIRQLIARVTAADVGGLLALPVVDTIKRADDGGRVAATVDRSALWRAQTPQMFRLGELKSALLAARDAGFAVTDEASAMERCGHAVQLVCGSADNLKITVPSDLALARWYLEEAEGND